MMSLIGDMQVVCFARVTDVAVSFIVSHHYHCHYRHLCVYFCGWKSDL